jgi:hypothetical protein
MDIQRAEDLSRLTAHDFVITPKGLNALDHGDQELTHVQMALLEAIDYVQNRGTEIPQAPVLARALTLAGEQGICPVCKYDWMNDPKLYCHCTAPHDTDAEERAEAYALSARQRTIRAQNELIEALAADEAAIIRLGQSFDAQSAEVAAVVPIQQGRRRPGGKRKRSS